MTASRNLIMPADIAEKKLRRMALEIVENNFEEEEVILAGIREKGFVVAQAIRDLLSGISKMKVQLTDISLDKQRPGDVKIGNVQSLDDKVVIIVDDVVNSGKTLTYAMKPFLAFHPRKIEILVLVERTHTHFPVRPDYVGLSIATTEQEQITVEVEGKSIRGAWVI